MVDLQFTLLDANAIYWQACIVTWVGTLLYTVDGSRSNWHAKTDNLHNFSKCDIFENFVKYERFIVGWPLF